MELAGQILSIVAMGVYILSFQAKKQNTIIFFQMLANSLFAISFFMLDAMMGMILNVISAIRALLFMYKKQLKTDNNIWFVGFILVYIATYVLSITMFVKELTPLTAILEFIPLIGMVATTIGYRAKNAKSVRVAGLINEPAWLVYNVYYFSIGAILCNVFSFISAIVGLIRFEKQKQQ